ncbi:MAG: non-lysosomal glucosylceramidase, partial [Armatimonadota bacterium]|nr:non-lysosomal glucosylceramidase [Armatimonadota bacterium]
GMPHFRDVEFRGEFPIATLDFRERRFPGRVRMTAFNPFIPINDRDSSLPAAFFEIEVKNTTKKTITYTIAATLRSPHPATNINTLRRAGKLTILHLTTDSLDPADIDYGDMALATDAADLSYQQYWFQSDPLWFADLEVFWRDFTSPGPLNDRSYPPDNAGKGTHGTIAAHLRVAPGKTARVRFLISWSFPNCENYWEDGARERATKAGVPPVWKNYYATLFEDSAATATYCLNNWDQLHRDTLLFKDALFSSDLPPAALDAVSANLSILKSPTTLRLEDGTFYGWEGCHAGAGCCEGSCTHVWNYAQALPFLFPKLERSMRAADFTHNQRPDGGMSFRMQLPVGSGRSDFRPCADGQFGGVLKTYRDWKISGDTDWLRSLWPAVKKSIEFAWSDTNEDKWDPGRTGVLHGRQHHTLDMELFGPNSWLTGFYLAALKAGAEIADHLGEHDTAADYRALFARGKQWVEDHLFNGEYYHQLLDLSDKSIPDSFGAGDAYWDEEHGEIRHQIGDGCGIDQVLAQWHADLYGLGDILDPKRVKRALRSIFKHNFKRSLRDLPNPCRIYSLNDEAGLLICEWPKGRHRPWTPAPYSSETMNGFEYAAAAHMIQRGMLKQGMQVVAAVRERYDGERRNPWNEFECGSNYARSMASYALLNAFSGFTFDMPRGLVGF